MNMGKFFESRFDGQMMRIIHIVVHCVTLVVSKIWPDRLKGTAENKLDYTQNTLKIRHIWRDTCGFDMTWDDVDHHHPHHDHH